MVVHLANRRDRALLFHKHPSPALSNPLARNEPAEVNDMEGRMNIYDEALFHIAEREMPIRDALESLCGHPSQATINHVLRTNEHLGGDWISCGQMLIITSPDCGAFTMLEQQMAIAARHMDMELSKLKPRQRELLAAHYVLLSNLSSYNIARYGWASNRFHHHKKNLERCLNRLDGLLEFG